MAITLTKAKAVRWVGIAVFVLSFLVPSVEHGEKGVAWVFKDNGFGAFCMTPLVLFEILGNGSGWRLFAASAALGGAWLTNFTVFAKLPRGIAWLPMAAPWVLFLTFMLDWFPNGSVIAGYLPFYLWAAGIALSHLPTYLRPSATEANSDASPSSARVAQFCR